MSRLSSPVYVWAAALPLISVTIFGSGCMLVRGVTNAVAEAVAPATMADLRVLTIAANNHATLQKDAIGAVQNEAAVARGQIGNLTVKVNTQEFSVKKADERIGSLEKTLAKAVADMRPLFQMQVDLKERVRKNIDRNEKREVSFEERLRAAEQVKADAKVARAKSSEALQQTVLLSTSLSDRQNQEALRLSEISNDVDNLRQELDTAIVDAAARNEKLANVDEKLQTYVSDVSGLRGWLKGSTIVGAVIGGVLATLATFATIMIARHRKVLDKTHEQSLAAFGLAGEARAEAKAISGLVSSEPSLLGVAAQRYRSSVKQDGEAVRSAFDEVVATLSKSEQIDLLARCKEMLPAEILQFLVDVAQKKPGHASSLST